MTLELRQMTEQADLQLVQEALARLAQGERTVTLPPALTSFLHDLLQHVQQGETLTVVTTEHLLSTTEAAGLLQVSRPFLIHNLLDAGLIPFHQVGTHRRILAADLLAYRQAQEHRFTLLDELAREAQELDLP